MKLAEGLSLPVDVVTQTIATSRGDRIWAAGLFEGEGTVTIGVRKSDETDLTWQRIWQILNHIQARKLGPIKRKPRGRWTRYFQAKQRRGA